MASTNTSCIRLSIANLFRRYILLLLIMIMIIIIIILVCGCRTVVQLAPDTVPKLSKYEQGDNRISLRVVLVVLTNFIRDL